MNWTDREVEKRVDGAYCAGIKAGRREAFYDYQIPERLIKDLSSELKNAKSLQFVNDPIAYALYQTWKKYDLRRKKNDNN